MKTDLICAIKKVKIIDESLPLENELATLESCNSPFLVSNYGSEKNDDELWVCLVAFRHD